jgi:phosphoglycerol geranylgeranyltransferase
MSHIYSALLQKVARGQKMLAVLIDPDKCCESHFEQLIELLKQHTPDYIFMGGSQLKTPFAELINQFKSQLKIPVIPGDATQFSPNADALLFLSLLSGRNAEYLIGQHVQAALPIKKSGLELIPTAYILIDGGRISAVEYISNTHPIPADRIEIAVSTALAGEMLGMKAIYLEAGSGANQPISIETIEEVKRQLTIPLIVGGGIRSSLQLENAFGAGADLVVIGNILEREPQMVEVFVKTTAKVNQQTIF